MWLLIFFLFITADTIMSNYTNCTSYSGQIIYFGYQYEEIRGLSSIEYSFESYRKMLGHLMKNLDHTMQLSELLERRNKRLQNLHIEFKRQVMSIPLLWERNENLLRFLTSQKKSLTYGLPAAPPPTLISTSKKTNEKFLDINENEYISGRISEENSQSAPPSYDSIEQVLY
jgi:hypothetical protein